MQYMQNDVIGELEENQIPQEMWKARKMRYGGTSAFRYDEK